MLETLWKFGKQLLLFCAAGALCGAAIGFFMYLQLGPFKSPEDAGYAAGLFVKSGAQLGLTVWTIRIFAMVIRRWVYGSSKSSTGTKPTVERKKYRHAENMQAQPYDSLLH